MKFVEIVFGNSCFYTISNSKFSSNNIIMFNMLFNVADLNDIDNFNYELSFDLYNELTYSFKDDIDKLNYFINFNCKFRIWTSHFDVRSYLVFLYLCDYLKDKNCEIYVVFSDLLYSDIPSPSCLKEHELEELSNLTCKLSFNDINYYSSEWMRVVLENGEMRIMDNKKVLSVDFSYYDNLIIDTLTELGIVKFSRLVGEIMKIYYVDDILLSFLIKRLIDKNTINVIKVDKNNEFNTLISI